MILYKYYGYDAGLMALKSQCLGFRKPLYFNDPFELSFLSNSEGPSSKQAELVDTLDELRNSVAILSLTRTADNALMWAHYAQEHSGFVIGYEVMDDFLTSNERNLIPVTSGDVVYTSTKNSHKLDLDVMGHLRNISAMASGHGMNDLETISLARKIFLTKHASWVYEEEVRVVKVPNSSDFDTHEFFTPTYIDENNIECASVEGLLIYKTPMSIREVYLGVRNPLPRSNEQAEYLAELAKQAAVFQCAMDEASWGLTAYPV